MIEFPKMLYKPNGTTRIDKKMWATVVVANAEEQKAAESEGWTTTPVEKKRGRPKKEAE